MTAGTRTSIGAALDEAIRRIRALEPGDAFDPRVPQAIREAGLHRLPVPGDAGGLGATMTEAASVLLALGAIDGSTALGLAMHVHSVGCIAGSNAWPVDLRSRVFRAVVDDGALCNNAATEEGGGSPARGAVPATTATRTDGGWRLRGEKTWTTWLPALSHAFVTARIDEPIADAGGGAAAATDSDDVELGVFLVELDMAGIERRSGFEALGMRASASGRLVLRDAFVPDDAVVVRRRAGEPDPRGPAPAAWFAMAVAATYLGVGEGVRADVARWALQRRPGDGATAVAEIPSVQLRLGRLDAALRVARIVLLDATGRWDAAPDDATRAELLSDLSLAKGTATNAAVAATDEALRIAGGPGFLAGRLERAFRDARAGLINPPLDDVALTGFGRAILDRAREGAS